MPALTGCDETETPLPEAVGVALDWFKVLAHGVLCSTTQHFPNQSNHYGIFLSTLLFPAIAPRRQSTLGTIEILRTPDSLLVSRNTRIAISYRHLLHSLGPCFVRGRFDDTEPVEDR